MSLREAKVTSYGKIVTTQVQAMMSDLILVRSDRVSPLSFQPNICSLIDRRDESNRVF